MPDHRPASEKQDAIAAPNRADNRSAAQTKLPDETPRSRTLVKHNIDQSHASYRNNLHENNTFICTKTTTPPHDHAHLITSGSETSFTVCNNFISELWDLRTDYGRFVPMHFRPRERNDHTVSCLYGRRGNEWQSTVAASCLLHGDFEQRPWLVLSHWASTFAYSTMRACSESNGSI